jgi:hypothetical protein
MRTLFKSFLCVAADVNLRATALSVSFRVVQLLSVTEGRQLTSTVSPTNLPAAGEITFGCMIPPVSKARGGLNRLRRPSEWI